MAQQKIRDAVPPSDKPYLTLPTSQIDLERRQAIEAGEEEAVVGEARSYAVEGNELDAYVGVSPEYMTYADDTQKPFLAEGDGPEAQVEQRFIETLSQPKEGVVTGADEDEVDGESNAEATGGDTPPPAAPAKD